MTKPRTETLEEFLARGGVIKHPKPIYPIVLKTEIRIYAGKTKEREHGKLLTYTRHKCRCEKCTEALRDYTRQYNAKKKARNEV